MLLRCVGPAGRVMEKTANKCTVTRHQGLSGGEACSVDHHTTNQALPERREDRMLLCIRSRRASGSRTVLLSLLAPGTAFERHPPESIFILVCLYLALATSQVYCII
ncbi:hypothetical protein NDU88_000501 [Pleurodeles waltl]|uniref:Uncharacterized protein n=1 Tax=Pleurodeles waltl TaxID=8319 RepID=A0AAV7LVP5_PLEWA|nr:hypothetical protein NDU88_000501 [Pleurodeles waltl]